MKLLSITFALILIHLSFSNKATKTSDCVITVTPELSIENADKLYITSNCTMHNFHFAIYDRWGELMYESKRFTEPMDLDITEKIKSGKKYKFKSGETYFWSLKFQESQIVHKAPTISNSGNLIIK